MKKLILILSAAAYFLVAGCNQGGTSGQGGSGNQYNTNAGGANSHNNATNPATHP